MAPPSAPHVFDAIEARIAQYNERVPAPFLYVDIIDPTERGGSPTVSLPTARRIALDPETDPALRDAIWRRLVQLAQQDRAHGPDGIWSAVTLWVLLPGLRRTVGRLTRYSHADTQDICSAVLLAALEAVHAADPEQPGLGELLWRAASSGGWRLAKAAAREYPVEDLEVAYRRRGARLDEPTEGGKAVHHGVCSFEGAPAPNAAQREGERLGAMIQRMGLGATVRTARLCTGTRVVGRIPHNRSAGRTSRTSHGNASS